MYSPLSIRLACSKFCFLACLVFKVQCLCPLNIFLLSALGAAAKQDDECVSVFGKVYTVSWPPIDDVFTDSIKPFHAGYVAKFQTQFRSNDFGSGLWIKAIEPCLVWIRSILAKVFFDFDFQF